MSLDLNIYTRNLSLDLIPLISQRFKDYKMDVEFHPEFRFHPKEDTGFLPIKLKVFGSNIKAYELNESILTGFELYIEPYDYRDELGELQKTNTPKQSLWNKLFKKQEEVNAVKPFVKSPEIDALLKNCTNNVLITFKPSNSSELRVAYFFAAFLAEVANGVIYECESGEYYTADDGLKVFPREVATFERAIAEDDFLVDKFEGWV